MDSIILNTAKQDRKGKFRDAGSELTVGDKADIDLDTAKALVDCGDAVKGKAKASKPTSKPRTRARAPKSNPAAKPSDTPVQSEPAPVVVDINGAPTSAETCFSS